jgi:hypothetical protein
LRFARVAHDDVESVRNTGNPAEKAEQNVDQEVSTAAAPDGDGEGWDEEGDYA